MLEEQDLAAGLADTSHLSQGGDRILIAAQPEGVHHGVESPIAVGQPSLRICYCHRLHLCCYPTLPTASASESATSLARHSITALSKGHGNKETLE